MTTNMDIDQLKAAIERLKLNEYHDLQARWIYADKQRDVAALADACLAEYEARRALEEERDALKAENADLRHKILQLTGQLQAYEILDEAGRIDRS